MQATWRKRLATAGRVGLGTAILVAASGQWRCGRPERAIVVVAASDPEVRRLLAAAERSPLRRAPFSPLPQSGDVGVARRPRGQRTGAWSQIEVSLVTMDTHGSHEWDFALMNGEAELVCETQTALGPGGWRFPEGPARERVIFASGVGGACIDRAGLRAFHVAKDGAQALEIEAACELVRSWRGAVVGSNGNLRATTDGLCG